MCRIWANGRLSIERSRDLRMQEHEGVLPFHCRSGGGRAAFGCSVFGQRRCSRSVTMYNAWWCPYCRQVRAILARNHIRYSILDVTSPQVQAIMLRRFGDTAVPRTVIGGVVVEGVDEARITQLCRG